MLSPSEMAAHTSQWHIAMPSGGGIHAINSAIIRRPKKSLTRQRALGNDNSK